ncbi:MAG: PspC domain-containing protein [Dermatophilaceae bacterium]
MKLIDRVVHAAGRTGIVRSAEGRVAFGVCRGIGARFDIDPVLVRVAFAAAVLFGGGLGWAIYSVLAVLLPDDSGRVPIVEAVRRRDGTSIAMVALAAAITIAVAVSFAAGMDGGRFLALAAIGVVCWLIWRRSPGPLHGARAGTVTAGAPASTPHTGPTSAAPPATPGGYRVPGDSMPVITPWEATAGTSARTQSAGRTPYTPQTAPYPATAVVPSAAVPCAPRRRSLGWRLWLVAGGLAIVTYTITRVALQASGASQPMWEIVPVAATAAALGLLLIVVGVVGYRTNGLAPAVAVIGVLALTSSAMSGFVPTGATMGEVSWTPSSAADLQQEYSVGMGEGTLDLTKIPATDLAGRTITLRVGLGDMRVSVPQDVAVAVDATVRMGDVTLLDTDGTKSVVSGMNQKSTVQSGAGPTLRVVADVGMGDARIERKAR